MKNHIPYYVLMKHWMMFIQPPNVDNKHMIEQSILVIMSCT